MLPEGQLQETAADLSVGIAITSDYISRGITNSDSKPAIQAYLEPSYGPIYAGVWTSNVDYGEGFEGAEIDTSFGFRAEIGATSVDIGYVHYFYAPEDTSPDYGEFFAKASVELPAGATAIGQIYFAPDYNQSGTTSTFVAGGIEVPVVENFNVYGGAGYQFFEDSSVPEQFAWMLGASYSWKMLTFDLRYWDTNLSDKECIERSGFADGCDERVVGTISFDTSRSDLKSLSRN